MVDVEYALTADGIHVAYRELNRDHSAPARDVVMVPGGLFPLEVFEEEPGFVRLLDGLRSLGRVIVFDRRGIGLSDPIVDWDRAVVEQWTDDLVAVVEASDARDLVLVGWDNFGVASRYAVMHRERVSALVLYEPTIVADENWPTWSERRIERGMANVRGEADILDEVAPTRIADRSFRDWYARAGRLGASPSTASRIWDSVMRAHPRDSLYEQVEVPTLVIHRRDNQFVNNDVLTLAQRSMPNAVLVELDGRDHFPFVGDVDAVVAEIAAFVVGERRIPAPQRLLSAVMFTDLVSSTARAASLGDEDWKSLLDRHDTVVRTNVGRVGGSVIKTTGDGALALIPSSAGLLRAAVAIRRDLAVEGLDVRIGAHVGDVDHRGNDVSGIAVNIASRAMSKADAGEVVVTAPVVAAAVGQEVGFETLGTHELKGVPGRWELFRLTDPPASDPP